MPKRDTERLFMVTPRLTTDPEHLADDSYQLRKSTLKDVIIFILFLLLYLVFCLLFGFLLTRVCRKCLLCKREYTRHFVDMRKMKYHQKPFWIY